MLEMVKPRVYFTFLHQISFSPFFYTFHILLVYETTCVYFQLIHLSTLYFSSHHYVYYVCKRLNVLICTDGFILSFLSFILC